jgi:biopolymer transport protein ExbD
MARKRRTGDYTEAEMPMVAMIDVVFQLFIFFIISMKPIDIYTNLTVSRPSADRGAAGAAPPPLMRINIYAGNKLAINGSLKTVPEMQKYMEKLAGVDSNQSILVLTSVKSTHDQLIQVLDMCTKSGLSKLSVLSTE